MRESFRQEMISTILKADRILVISGGVITEAGDHESLLAQDGIYRELYETQFRRVLEYETETHVLHPPGHMSETLH